MSKLFKPLMISALVAGAVGNVQAESGVNWVTTAGVSQKTLEYGLNTGGVLNADFVGINIGITAVFDKFYITSEIDQALTEGALDDELIVADASSDAITVTVGCNCLPAVESLSLFVGYTSIDITIDGGEDFTENSNDAGLFIGGSHPLLSSESGQLTASFAFALLDGQSDISSSLLPVDVRLTGDTTGLSYGIAWSGSISENMNYSVSAKVNDYSFDAKRFTNSGGGSGAAAFELDRIFTILSGRVTYFF